MHVQGGALRPALGQATPDCFRAVPLNLRLSSVCSASPPVPAGLFLFSFCQFCDNKIVFLGSLSFADKIVHLLLFCGLSVSPSVKHLFVSLAIFLFETVLFLTYLGKFLYLWIFSNYYYYFFCVSFCYFLGRSGGIWRFPG